MSASPPPAREFDVAVIGGGVLGLTTAAVLALRGQAVAVLDPGGPNASSIAAGMLAPAMEVVLDDCDSERASLLKSARDLWPDFAARTGIHLHREGVEWRGADPDKVLSQLQALGFTASRRAAGVFTPDDWRLDPVEALERLRTTPGVTIVRARVDTVRPDAGGWRVAGAGVSVTARAAVVASGWTPHPPRCGSLVDKLVGQVSPIAGQIVRLHGETPSCVRRGSGGYLVPYPGGALAGATMEAGQGRPTVNPETQARLVASAHALAPEGRFEVRDSVVGVRGATPDGLPMAGLVEPGLAVALAPRRNGWLLAPLVADTVAGALAGRAPGSWAAALDPARFF